nr:hypothetical protein [Jiangella muralis]
MGDAEAVVRRVRDRTPFYVVRVGAEAGGRPTADLRDPDVAVALIGELGRRIGAAEVRVAVSALFLGYASRLWCLAIGTAELTGRGLDLDPGALGWSSSRGTLTLHCRAPRLGATPAEEVVDRQLTPLVRAWSRLDRSRRPVGQRRVGRAWRRHRPGPRVDVAGRGGARSPAAGRPARPEHVPAAQLLPLLPSPARRLLRRLPTDPARLGTLNGDHSGSGLIRRGEPQRRA